MLLNHKLIYDDETDLVDLGFQKVSFKEFSEEYLPHIYLQINEYELNEKLVEKLIPFYKRSGLHIQLLPLSPKIIENIIKSDNLSFILKTLEHQKIPEDLINKYFIKLLKIIPDLPKILLDGKKKNVYESTITLYLQYFIKHTEHIITWNDIIYNFSDEIIDKLKSHSILGKENI